MLDSFFIYDIPPIIETGHYQIPLVVLSYVVASFASYTALLLAQQLTATQNTLEKRWLHWGGAFAMGAGIWSMHFIGMLSYKMRMVVEYDPLLTLLSMLIAIAVAYGALGIVTRERLLFSQILIGGVLMGMGICGMHYTGMAAMIMDADLRYIPSIFVVSVIIAIAASIVALWMTFVLSKHSSIHRYLFQICAALIMGAAICGMHYTGMYASIFIPFAQCRYDPNQNFDVLALVVAGITTIILGMALGVGVYRKAQTELQLRNSESKLRAMIDNALDAVIAMDHLGYITEWNKQAEFILGWSYQEAIGKPLADLIIPNEYRKLHQQGLQKFIEGGVGPILNRRIEMTALRKNGDFFPVELTVTAQKHDAYNFTAFIRDITERKQAEETKGLLAAIVESSDNPIISKTLDGIITSWNTGAERLFGYKAAEAVGQHISFIIPSDRQQEEQTIAERLRAGKRVENLETIRIAKNGRRVNISLTASPIYNANGKIIGSSKIVHDIAERKQNEAQLKMTMEALFAAKKVAEEAQHKAESASQAKSEFLANMSHEIRTPLNSIIGTGELLAGTTLNKEQHDYVNVLTTAGDILLSLINNILDFSKIESGAIEIARQPIRVKSLLEEIEQVIAESAKTKNIAFSVSCSNELTMTLLGDPIRLKQILLNLASNAIKFCPQGKISMSAELLRKEKDTLWLRFSVEDSGMGIPSDKLETVFEKFTQLDEFSTKKYAGTGLGLAICKRLVEVMGGTINVTSTLGKGSLFWFDLPFAESNEIGSDSAHPAIQEKSIPWNKDTDNTPIQGKILLVEDYPPNRQMAKKILENMGCTVATAQNGEEALERMAEDSYDIVFMDCQMPEMDGFQTTAEIRKREKDKRTIIIAMTAHVLIGDRERCFQAGMDDYVSKPIRTAELNQMLRKHLAA